MRIKVLFEECLLFQKRAEKVSVVDNTEPFLKQLSDIKGFDDRVAFAEEHCQKKLGEGSSRTAFQLSSDFIIKVAHNEKGLAQSKEEMQVSLEGRECVNNAIVADAEYKWIIFKNSEKITEKRFKEIVGCSFKHFTDSLFAKFNNESDRWPEHKDYGEISENPFFLCCAEIVFSNDLLLGDLSKISSYRERDGKIILSDVGFTKTVYRDFYEDDSSSSSSSSTVKTTEES